MDDTGESASSNRSLYALYGVLIVVGGAWSVDLKTSKIAEIGVDLGRSTRTSRVVTNRRVPADSAH